MQHQQHIAFVLEYAVDLVNCGDKGGRGVLGECGTVGYLLDCPCWPDEYSQAVTARFPMCGITISSAQDISTTGFAVYFALLGQQREGGDSSLRVDDATNPCSSGVSATVDTISTAVVAVSTACACAAAAALLC